MLKGRLAAALARPPKVAIPTSINFDDTSSVHCTLMEIVTQDRAGLLYEVGSALARLACNIEVALVTTEGHRALDVFYITRQGSKLSSELEDGIKSELNAALAAS